MFRDNMSDQLIARLSQCEVVIQFGRATMAGGPPNIKGTMVASTLPGYKPSIPRGGFISASAGLLSYGRLPSTTRGEGRRLCLTFAVVGSRSRCIPMIRLVITLFRCSAFPTGGAFKNFRARCMKLKMAVAQGPGNQHFPWIDIRDLNKAICSCY